PEPGAVSLPGRCPALAVSSPPRRVARRARHSFPTRRSSDLEGRARGVSVVHSGTKEEEEIRAADRNDARASNPRACCSIPAHLKDRKSTRLNSSHVAISYAVFCLKKKSEHVRRVLRRSYHVR